MSSKLFLLALVMLLSGCSSIFMSNYDNYEHSLYNEIRTVSELGKTECSNKEEIKKIVKTLYFKASLLKNYAGALDNNEKSFKISEDLKTIISELHKRYSNVDEVSSNYCELKLTSIEKAAAAAQYNIVRKPK